MKKLEKILRSGASLDVSLASWQEGHLLFKETVRILSSLNRGMEIDDGILLVLLCNDTIEKALWPCMARGNYKGIKITPQLFEEHEEARNDYLDIAGEVLGFNLLPFLGDVSSKLKATPGSNTDTQK